jgi:hypothetical protein
LEEFIDKLKEEIFVEFKDLNMRISSFEMRAMSEALVLERVMDKQDASRSKVRFTSPRAQLSPN